MRFSRKATAGVLGSALVALALLAMGSGAGARGGPGSTNFGDPLEGLPSDLRTRFEAGKDVFERNFTPREGLGPVFNNTSCAKCHNQGSYRRRQ